VDIGGLDNHIQSAIVSFQLSISQSREKMTMIIVVVDLQLPIVTLGKLGEDAHEKSYDAKSPVRANLVNLFCHKSAYCQWFDAADAF